MILANELMALGIVNKYWREDCTGYIQAAALSTPTATADEVIIAMLQAGNFLRYDAYVIARMHRLVLLETTVDALYDFVTEDPRLAHRVYMIDIITPLSSKSEISALKTLVPSQFSTFGEAIGKRTILENRHNRT